MDASFFTFYVFKLICFYTSALENKWCNVHTSLVTQQCHHIHVRLLTKKQWGDKCFTNTCSWMWKWKNYIHV